MDVRQIGPDAWVRFRGIRLRALADSPSAFGSTVAGEHGRSEREWRERLGRSDGAMFACVEGDAWLGVAGTYVEPGRPALAWVISMWVAPEGRRRGVGRILLETCVEWARQHAAEEVRLWVTTVNAPARGLYESAGFEPTGATQPLPSDPTLDELELRLGLGTGPGR